MVEKWVPTSQKKNMMIHGEEALYRDNGFLGWMIQENLACYPYDEEDSSVKGTPQNIWDMQEF